MDIDNEQWMQTQALQYKQVQGDETPYKLCTPHCSDLAILPGPH